MDAGVDVLLDETFRNDDRVLEVVTAPRHVGDQHVPAERELPVLRGRTVGEDVALLDGLSAEADRPLVHAGACVAAQIFVKPVILVRILRRIGGRQIAVRRHDDVIADHLGDDAVGHRRHHRAGVAGNARLKAGPDQR